jgi:DNA polymerase III epsilon subunit-like protein
MSDRMIVFDVETGGVEDRHPTIQLAALAVDAHWNEIATFEQKIEFDVGACDPAALEMNHYDPEQWEDAVSPAVTAARFAAFVRPYADVEMISKRTGRPYHVAKLAGYNALTFDLPRLKALFGATFFPCSYQVRDVLQRVLWHFEEHAERPPENFKLATVAAHLGIDPAGAHDALADVRLTAAVYRRLAGW